MLLFNIFFRQHESFHQKFIVEKAEAKAHIQQKKITQEEEAAKRGVGQSQSQSQ